MTQHFSPDENAPAIRWSWLARGLVKCGFQVTVLTASWTSEETQRPIPGLTIHRVRNLIPGPRMVARLVNEAIIAARSFLAATRSPRPALIIVTAPPLTMLPFARLLAICHQCPLVYDLRDVWPELLHTWPEWNDDGVRTARHSLIRRLLIPPLFGALDWWLRRLQRLCNLVVTTSQWHADAIQERTTHPVICVRNAPVEVPRCHPPVDTDGCLRVLYLGNVGRSQYLASAIRAAALAQRNGTNIRLRVVGGGAQLWAIRRLAAELDAPVEFHGRVPRAEAVRHYAWADTVLVILRDWAPFTMTVPSKLYEALACGRHISASLAGEAADIVRRTQAGDVVEPENPEALASLWTGLAADRSRLKRSDADAWLRGQADRVRLTERYATALHELLVRTRS